jgi:hypothetical protein
MRIKYDLDLSIIISVNKKDLWFCRLCVASIRYYYSEIEIFLIKDELNGQFNTSEIERIWNVKLYELNRKNFGWGASKTFFLLQAPNNKKYLVLDSDIVFIGPFIESLYNLIVNFDFVISADYEPNPKAKWIKNVYFDLDALRLHDPEYKYPGYFFNTGQIFISGGKIGYDHIGDYFSKVFPFWKRKDLLPLVDQSLYNYIMPKMAENGKISIGLAKYMIWSESVEAKEIELASVKDKTLSIGLIHWAGVVRNPSFFKMSRPDILHFFEHYYYRNIPYAWFRKIVRRFFFLFHEFKDKINNKICG